MRNSVMIIAPDKCCVWVQAGVDADGRDRDDPSVETSIGLGSQFLHLVQNSGFQLINVNNVAIQLKVRLSERRGCGCASRGSLTLFPHL